MTAALGILVIAMLFALFPLVKRERRGGCGTGGCWKKQLGFGCGSCPLDRAPGAKPDRPPEAGAPRHTGGRNRDW